MSARLRSARPLLLGAVGFAAFLIVWQAVAAGPLSDTSFPYAFATLDRLAGLVRTGEFWGAVGDTLSTSLVGFATATAIGVPLGLAMGSSRTIDALVRVPIEVAKPIPPIVILPLVVYSLGPTASMSRFLIVVGLVPAIAVATAAGVRDVDPLAIETARSFRLHPLDRSVRIVLPGATPFVITGLRIAAFGALLTAVMSEVVGGAPGLGAQLSRARRANLPETAYAWVLAIAILGFLTDRVVTLVERRALHWHISQRHRRRAGRRPLLRTPAVVGDVASRIVLRIADVLDEVPRPRQRRSTGDSSAAGRPRVLTPALSVATTACLIAWWWFASEGSTSLLFRPLSDIVRRFQEIWLFDRFGSDAIPSLRNLAVGFAIAAVVGITLGLVIAMVPIIGELLEPVLALFRSLPGVAFVPILITVMGFGTSMRITTIALAATFPVLIATVDGIRGVDSVTRDVAHSFRLTLPRRLWFVYLPAAMPRIFTGLEIGLATAVVVMIASELSGVTVGIGAQTILAQNTFEFDDMWAGVLLLAVVGLGANLLFRLVRHLVLGWYRGWRRSSQVA